MVAYSGRWYALSFEFLCRHVIPGCSERLEATSEDEVRVRVADHLRDSHEIETLEDHMRTKVEAAIRPTYG